MRLQRTIPYFLLVVMLALSMFGFLFIVSEYSRSGDISELARGLETIPPGVWTAPIISPDPVTANPTPLTAVVAYAAAMLALIGWVVQSRISIRNLRKQHSIKLLFEARMNAAFLSRLELIREAYPLGSEVFTPAPAGTARPPVDSAIIWMLNYYEFIAVAIWHGDLDGPIMRDCIRSQYLHFTHRAYYFISRAREVDARGRPSRRRKLTYLNLVRLRDQWRRSFVFHTGRKAVKNPPMTAPLITRPLAVPASGATAPNSIIDHAFDPTILPAAGALPVREGPIDDVPPPRTPDHRP